MPEHNGVCQEGLSLEDRRHLREYDEALELVRVRTRGVANGHSLGLALHGPGGIGKSYSVLQELDQLKANYCLMNSRVSARGLFDTLLEHPDAIVVVEDCETLLKEPKGVSVLRSALWCQPKPDSSGPQARLVTWKVHKTDLHVTFTGSIILTSNAPIMNSPELAALKTRIDCLELRPTERQIHAMMRSLSLRGFEHNKCKLTPQECGEVCKHVIAQTQTMKVPPNIRLLIKAFQDRCQWELADSSIGWRDLVITRVREEPTKFQEKVCRLSKKDRTKMEMNLALDIKTTTRTEDEALRTWKDRTGLSRATFYRRLAECWQTIRSDLTGADLGE